MNKHNEQTPTDQVEAAATETEGVDTQEHGLSEEGQQAEALDADVEDASDFAELEELDLDDLKERIIELQSENAGLADQFVRAKAETGNTRRISAKEVEKARKFALESFSKELLQVKDSLDQATQVDLTADSGEQIIKQMQAGLALTARQLNTIFERFNIEQLSPEIGEAVDPELHQAMTIQASEEVEKGRIISVIQTGYRLNTRLLRPAMVIVSSGK